jgi:hypothetical protein
MNGRRMGLRIIEDDDDEKSAGSDGFAGKRYVSHRVVIPLS